MLAVAEAYYAELFSRRACDPVAEAALLDCVSARLGARAQSMGRAWHWKSIDQEKAFDRVQHGFLHGVLKRMGFGPRFIGWVRTLYAGVYSCQYADDTTLFVSSVRASLARIRALTDLFGAGTGSKVNLAKSSVLCCGSWRGDRSGGGFSVCTGGLKILGVRFFARESAALNWEARLNLVRTRLGVWTRRQLSLTGRVVVVRSVLLPLLIHLAYVFPVPARTKLALTRLVFGSCGRQV
ncbi:hypothetical protein AAFF_G00014690 [Aldrovandia affinis]|uniref:Reverse transcriptase domain-containing protein n=1 Tax=Aldrovandia affinis TaxID=143900 RepID=A0AAD7R2L8_9TELE|nr:hypothetical protein AAFF_G00014690 [Aldrovandia affinis]